MLPYFGSMRLPALWPLHALRHRLRMEETDTEINQSGLFQLHRRSDGSVELSPTVETDAFCTMTIVHPVQGNEQMYIDDEDIIVSIGPREIVLTQHLRFNGSRNGRDWIDTQSSITVPRQERWTELSWVVTRRCAWNPTKPHGEVLHSWALAQRAHEVLEELRRTEGPEHPIMVGQLEMLIRELNHLARIIPTLNDVVLPADGTLKGITRLVREHVAGAYPQGIPMNIPTEPYIFENFAITTRVEPMAQNVVLMVMTRTDHRKRPERIFTLLHQLLGTVPDQALWNTNGREVTVDLENLHPHHTRVGEEITTSHLLDQALQRYRDAFNEYILTLERVFSDFRRNGYVNAVLFIEE